jgi:hypothetical protein
MCPPRRVNFLGHWLQPKTFAVVESDTSCDGDGFPPDVDGEVVWPVSAARALLLARSDEDRLS